MARVISIASVSRAICGAARIPSSLGSPGGAAGLPRTRNRAAKWWDAPSRHLTSVAGLQGAPG